MKKTTGSILVLLCICVSIFAQGPLTPPAAPAPTMKTLDQVEARTIINATNTPGNGTNQFVISTPGSYYLTGNITGVSGKNGILVNNNNVTIDLNGFVLNGVSGSLAGISDGGSNHGNATVRNGGILNWSGAGIDLGASFDSRIEHLIVTNNGGIGMKMSDACALRDCVARDNIGDNIVTGFNANLTHCTAVGSQNGYGINLQGVATDCVANFNKSVGIIAGNNSTISNCAAASNIGGGIYVGNGSTVTGCAASGNGSGSGTVVGIQTGSGCTVTDSSASYNTVLYGIVANPGCTLTHCTASNNTSAQATSAGILAAGATVIGCTANNNTNTNASASHTTGMGIYNNGANAMIKNCTLLANKGDGINVGTYCVLTENQSNNNGTDGIFATNNLNRIENNHTNFNGGIGIHAGADWVIRNTSSNNGGGNFLPTAGGDIAPIQTASTATNPFANLQ
ncbi:MAG: hypothetical protein ACJ8KX_07205 [Chthoniobacterales bacterium]